MESPDASTMSARPTLAHMNPTLSHKYPHSDQTLASLSHFRSTLCPFPFPPPQCLAPAVAPAPDPTVRTIPSSGTPSSGRQRQATASSWPSTSHCSACESTMAAAQALFRPLSTGVVARTPAPTRPASRTAPHARPTPLRSADALLPPAPPAATPDGHLWVLVPVPLVPQTRMLESEAHAVYRERQQAS